MQKTRCAVASKTNKEHFLDEAAEYSDGELCIEQIHFDSRRYNDMFHAERFILYSFENGRY